MNLICAKIRILSEKKAESYCPRTIKKDEEVFKMKEGIHPQYFQATVTCNCGNEFTTGSTKEKIHTEICSKCHPFYTGQQKAANAKGRIEQFNRRYGVKSEQ